MHSVADGALLPSGLALSSVASSASLASRAARPRLLELLNETAVRSRLNAPLASWPADALLTEVERLLSVAEIMHVKAETADLFAATNLVGARLPDGEAHERLARGALYRNRYRARPVYSAMNLIGAATGAPWYGNVTLVLAPAYFASFGACVPADSGKLYDCCVRGPCVGSPKLSCRGVLQTAHGTAGALDHTLLASHMLWREQPRSFGGGELTNVLADLLSAHWRRPQALSLQQPPPSHASHNGSAVANAATAGGRHVMTTSQWEPYIECTLAESSAHDPIDRTVKLAIGRFAPLFGTPSGKALRAWALSRRIALAWALEDAHDGPYSWERWAAVPYVSGYRQLDPSSVTVAPSPATAARLEAVHEDRNRDEPDVKPLLSVRLDESAAVSAAVDRLWAAAAAARTANLARGIGLRLTREEATGFWRNLTAIMPASTRVEVPSPGACADWNICVGKSDAGACVCYASETVGGDRS